MTESIDQKVERLMKLALRPAACSAGLMFNSTKEARNIFEAAVRTELVRSQEVTDAKRLNWLQSQTEAYGFENEHEGNRWVIDGPFMFVRDAIDAAIASTKQSEGKL